MKIRLYFSLFFSSLAIFSCLNMVRAEDPVPKPVTEKIELFNGRNLDNWYVFLKGHQVGEDPDNVFTVEDGMIHISGNGFGCITSKEAFCDYQIIVEFKWGEKTWQSRVDRARDCGLLVHSVGEDGAYGGIWKCSIEANIIEGGMGDFIVVGDNTDNFSLTANVAPQKSKFGSYIYQKDGEPVTINSGRIDWYGRDPDWEDKTNFRGRNDLTNPHGEWNTLKIICKGDTLDVYLNGTLVNQAYNVKPAGGQIQLQAELAEIFFRRVTLLPLDAEE